MERKCAVHQSFTTVDKVSSVTPLSMDTELGNAGSKLFCMAVTTKKMLKYTAN